MALITGGMSGLGMVASYEHAMAGRERIVAVSRTAYLSPGEQEAHLLDVIQDMATHYVIRCDIADAGAWTDALAFANNISAHDEYDPQTTMKDAQTQLKQMDSLDVIDVLIASLRGMIEAGSPIDAAKLNRVLFFRNNMSRGLKETMEKFRTQQVDMDTQEKLFQFQDSLRELSELIELFRKRGLVEERPGAADAGPMGGIFPGEAAMTTQHGMEARQRDNPKPQAGGAGGSEADRQTAAPAKDVLLELMEKELAHKQAPKLATQSRSTGPISSLDATGDLMPGQSRPHNEKLGHGTEASPEPSKAAKEPSKGTSSSPEVSSKCDRCGNDCAISCALCSECQRVSERGALEGAIRRAKEEARLKAQREAERKAQREEAEWKAKQDAERRAKEELEQQAKAEAMQRAKEEALQKAQAKAELKAKEEAERQAQEAAHLQIAERLAKEEADRKSLDDIVCLKGHALQSFTAQAGFPCDLCQAESTAATVMWGCRNKNDRDCRTCDFDICGQCSTSRVRRMLRANGEAV
mmetsp:Transcript_7006/g.19822  ORF Transcript_7006/g.19822 Transcript_7006/m.19822 type:complete len:525 (+) Transcript_7006:70-1644(+)